VSALLHLTLHAQLPRHAPCDESAACVQSVPMHARIPHHTHVPGTLQAISGRAKADGLHRRLLGQGQVCMKVRLKDPQTKRQRFIGRYASEEDAARAYDCAAVQAHGPDAKRNFPGEAISELPVSLGEERKQRSSSRYIGVCWYKARSVWCAYMKDPETKRRLHIGTYVSEEDAARAFDCAAVKAHGPGARRNFPGEAINDAPEAMGELKKQRRNSRSR
jgi:hypothetical protein